MWRSFKHINWAAFFVCVQLGVQKLQTQRACVGQRDQKCAIESADLVKHDEGAVGVRRKWHAGIMRLSN